MVRKMAQFTDAERKDVETFVRAQPAPRKFDTLGLRFDLAYLVKLHSTIIGLPLEYIACYADQATYQAIKEGDIGHLREVLTRMPKIVDEFGATLIGNLARICLYCENNLLRSWALETLNRVSEWYGQHAQMAP